MYAIHIFSFSNNFIITIGPDCLIRQQQYKIACMYIMLFDVMQIAKKCGL